MHAIRTEIDIDASPARVWTVLTDFGAYPDWNPFFTSVTGRAEVGQQLVATVRPNGGAGITFKPTVLKVDKDKEFRWRGKLLVPGLFDGEHYFTMEPKAAGGTRFVHGEHFSGLLVGLAKSTLDKGTKNAFIAMNKALKVRAESAP